MELRSLTTAALALGLVAAATVPAHAQITTYFGRDFATLATYPLDTAAKRPNSEAARNSFLSVLVAPKTETFESIATGNITTTPGVTIFTGDAQLKRIGGTGATNVRRISNNNTVSLIAGRYAAGGNRFVEAVNLGNNGIVSVNFLNDIHAFGFYMVDSTFSPITVGFYNNGASIGSQSLQTTGVLGNGGIFYAGFTSLGAFDEVRILSPNLLDGVGIDDMTYATSVVPEPGEWAAMGVLGAGLTGLIVRKRRRAA